MVNPVPGVQVSTPWGRRGRHWSCRRDAAGNGIHTGADFAAATGTLVVAARPGITRHVNYGASFGTRQLAVFVADGTLDFYAHMSSRVAAGLAVAAGDRVGAVGTEGNSTGPHLHFERHATQRGWSCDNVTDPAPSIAWTAPGQPGQPPPPPSEDDMTPEQAQTLDQIAWLVNQIKPQTDRLTGIQEASDLNRWGIHDEEKGLRRALADVHARLAVIESRLPG